MSRPRPFEYSARIVKTIGVSKKEIREVEEELKNRNSELWKSIYYTLRNEEEGTYEVDIVYNLIPLKEVVVEVAKRLRERQDRSQPRLAPSSSSANDT